MDQHAKDLIERIQQERFAKWGQESKEAQERMRQLVKNEELLAAAAKEARKKYGTGSGKRQQTARLVALWQEIKRERDAQDMKKRTYLTNPKSPS